MSAILTYDDVVKNLDDLPSLPAVVMELLNSIDQALQSTDWPTAAASAHKLKPSMGFFGMLISQGLLQEVELLCKAGGQEPDQIRTKYFQAKDLIETNLTALSRIKAEKEAGI